MSTVSRYPLRAVRLDGKSRMTNPIATNRPNPTARSITTLVTAFRQSQPSRTSNHEALIRLNGGIYRSLFERQALELTKGLVLNDD